MARENYYAILGVPKKASADEIKRAYRRLALESHPDRYPGDAEAEERFRHVSEAYSVLSEPAKRARYDASQLLPQGLDLSTPATVPTAREVFSSVFGDVFGRRRKARRKGRDIRYTLTVSLAEAVHGSEHEIKFDSFGPCSSCRGAGTKAGGREPEDCELCTGTGEVKSGGLLSARTKCGRCDGTGMVQRDPCESCRGKGSRREKRSFTVRLAAGTKAGAERLLSGQGEPGRFGGEPGHLRVTVNVKPEPYLTRNGDDIHCEVPVSISEAALGAKIPVPTVDGWVDMELPAGASSGLKMRLREKGVPRARGGRGDEIVEVRIETPAAKTKARGRLDELLGALEEESARTGALVDRAKMRKDALGAGSSDD